MALTKGTKLGPYEIHALLGAGGMGEVYRALDSRLHREVAVKVLRPDLSRDPESAMRFEREAKAVAALSHPNIIAIHDFGSQDGILYAVMELLEGETLRKKLTKGAVPQARAAAMAVEIAQGLAAAHEVGIVHRDLKPENVFVTRKGRIKILDFGLARVHREGAAGEESLSSTISMRTTPGLMIGTLGYMSPEQVRGLRVDHRSDIFSFGALLYELLTGRQAFRGANAVETLNAILTEEPLALSSSGGSEIPPGLGSIVRRCLDKDADKRFQSALDMSYALEALIGVTLDSPVAAAAPRSERVARGQRKRKGQVERPAQPAYQRLTVRRGGIMSARFSSDKTSILYTAAWDHLPPEVYETHPGFPTSRAIGLPEANLLSISRSWTMAVTLGHGTFESMARPGTLAEVARTGGLPRGILEDVVASDWLSDGRTLAVSRVVDGKARIELPRERVLYETSGILPALRVSPGDKWLAFVEGPIPGDTRGAVVIMEASGSVIARTQDWSEVGGLAWSSDGREVWFSAASAYADSYEIRAITPAGKQRVVQRVPSRVNLLDIASDGRVLLTRSFFHAGIRSRRSPGEDEHELSWLDFSVVQDISADGRQLLFDEQALGGGPLYSVWLRGTDGSPAVRLGEGNARALSPDGKWALALHFGPPQSLLVLPTGTGESATLPRGEVGTYGSEARWLLDGKRIIYVGSTAGHDSRTYLQEIHEGLPQAITAEGLTGTSVSPDGLLLAAISSDRRLYICPLDAGDPRFLADLLPREHVLQWTSDGKGIYLAEYRGASVNVVCMERDSGRRKFWGTFSVSDPAGVTLYRLLLNSDAQSYAYGYHQRLDDLYMVEGLK